ncbi:archaemetzincin-2 isoform X2 [Podarcis muralis]
MKVIKHSEEVLKAALVSKDTQLAKLYEKFNPKEKCLLNEAFRPGSVLFKPITLHSESDWISSHPEPTQDFAQFYHDPCRKTPTPQKNRIYVQPIGSFGDSRVSTDVYMKWLKDYCEAFYYGLIVRILGPVPVSHTGCPFRINENTHNLQIHAGHLLSYLKKKKPKDAFCIVGVTMIDLYPKDSWNFVFGQASLTEGMGIFSFARYDSDFYSANYKGTLKTTKKLPPSDYSVFDGYYTPEITSKLLLRSCKVDPDSRDWAHLWTASLPVVRMRHAGLQPFGGIRPTPIGSLPHLSAQATVRPWLQHSGKIQGTAKVDGGRSYWNRRRA